MIHSTSGNSPNVLRAAEAARREGARCSRSARVTVARCAGSPIIRVIIPTERTDRAQELHLCIEHIICDLVEQTL